MNRIKVVFLLLIIIFSVSIGAKISKKNRIIAINQSAQNSIIGHELLSKGLRTHINQIYHQAQLSANNLDSEVFFKAMVGYYDLENEGKLNASKNIITVIDFSLPSTEKRLWVIDLDSKKVLFNTLVAHGRNSGQNMAHFFSNKPHSFMSSLGFFVTGKTYRGKHGLSLHINGMETGFNSNARKRAVVIHGADYVSRQFIQKYGRLGRSEGCPALPVDIAPDVIHAIAGKTALFIYYPNEKYEANTQYFNLAEARNAFHSSQQTLAQF